MSHTDWPNVLGASEFACEGSYVSRSQSRDSHGASQKRRRERGENSWLATPRAVAQQWQPYRAAGRRGGLSHTRVPLLAARLDRPTASTPRRGRHFQRPGSRARSPTSKKMLRGCSRARSASAADQPDRPPGPLDFVRSLTELSSTLMPRSLVSLGTIHFASALFWWLVAVVGELTSSFSITSLL